MEVAETVHSKNAEVRILKGNYMGNENPVLKVYRSQSDSEMKKEISIEVTNLKQVQHYIAGGFVRTAERKNDVYLLLKNMGVALDENDEGDKAKYERLEKSTRDGYYRKYGMLHMYVYGVIIHLSADRFALTAGIGISETLLMIRTTNHV